MINRRQCQRISDFIITYAGDRVRGIEVLINGLDEASSRFANNELTDHLHGTAASVTIGVQLKGRTAVFSGDDLTRAGLRRLVDGAIAYAEHLPHDNTTLALIKPSDRTSDSTVKAALRHYDDRVERLIKNEAARVKHVQAVLDVARRYRQKAAGIYQVTTSAFSTANSNGVFRFDRQTDVECSVTMTSRTASGWQKECGNTVKSVNVTALAERAAQIAVKSRDPIYVRPGEYTVILTPAAVLDLIGFLFEDLEGSGHWDESSSFAGKIGKRILGRNITIRDDVYHPLQFGCPFDDEGLNREVVTLVENGVIRNPVKSRRSVIELGGHATGHGVGPSAGEGEGAVNIVMEGGDSSLEEMIASTKRGLLMTRVWYVRDVDPNTKLLTGMTRDGTFLIEDGKLKRGVKNMRFNQSAIQMLRHAVELGKPVLAAGEECFPAVVPPMKVENFRFSSRTRG